MIRRQDDIRNSKEGRRAFRVESCLPASLRPSQASPPSWLSMSRNGARDGMARCAATVYVSCVLTRFPNRFAAVLVVELPYLPREWRLANPPFDSGASRRPKLWALFR